MVQKNPLLTPYHNVELSLTVPITNSLAFLFTVLGEWWAEGKVITRGTQDYIKSKMPDADRVFLRHMDRNGARLGRNCALRSLQILISSMYFEIGLLCSGRKRVLESKALESIHDNASTRTSPMHHVILWRCRSRTMHAHASLAARTG